MEVRPFCVVGDFMSLFRGIFSDDYNDFLKHRDKIRALVIRAQDELKGGKLYGMGLDINNPEHMIAALYLLYRDKEMFHEPLS